MLRLGAAAEGCSSGQRAKAAECSWWLPLGLPVLLGCTRAAGGGVGLLV